MDGDERVDVDGVDGWVDWQYRKGHLWVEGKKGWTRLCEHDEKGSELIERYDVLIG